MILVVCEKPSVARDIAAVLSCKQRGEGYLQSQTHIVTWAIGHLLSPMMPEEIDEKWKGWRAETLPILPASIPMKALPSGKKQLSVIKKLMRQKEVKSIICATDAGREGELIFRRILEEANCKKPVQRLWISSMTKEAIEEGFARLAPMAQYDLLYQSAKCRADADWLVGMNGSRAFTIRYGALLSVGRVQTPTLALIVRRKQEIDQFVPEQYFELEADFGAYKGTYTNGKESRLPTREQAAHILAQVKGQTGTITQVQREQKHTPPPYLYDLTTLQREANARFSMTAAATLKAAQALYETHKLITYPRTDSRHLPMDMRKKAYAMLDGLPPAYAPLRPAAPNNPGKRMFDDAKITDHHAIIPTGKAPPASLAPQEARLYDMVLRRFVAGFCDDFIYEATQVITSVQGHDFQTKGKQSLQLGWQAVNPPIRGKGQEDEQQLPFLEQGARYLVKHIEILEKATRPPSAYTENTLLDAMEHAGRFVQDEALRAELKERGLGTPATRAAIIERLIEVEYIYRDKRNLLPTPKGVRLISVCPPQLVSPETTGQWEKGLKNIERGKLAPQRFMDSIARYCAFLVDAAKTAPAVDFPKEPYTPKKKPSRGKQAVKRK